MGQYHIPVNITKKEFLDPHMFGDGLKLMEFGLSGCGTLSGLTILLSNANGRGGGDLHSENPIIGHWAGDQIVIAGDYGDEGEEFTQNPSENLYDEANKNYKDVSAEVLFALLEDKYVCKTYKNEMQYLLSSTKALIEDIILLHNTKENKLPLLMGSSGDEIWEFKSNSGNRVYKTIKHANGNVTCNCPGWTKNKKRRCWHTTAVLNGTAETQSVSHSIKGIQTDDGQRLLEKMLKGEIPCVTK